MIRLVVPFNDPPLLGDFNLLTLHKKEVRARVVHELVRDYVAKNQILLHQLKEITEKRNGRENIK
ncbi:MAG: hypothetical protein HYT66_00950 [Candidatus Yanofskybacteria bacterium]|nr:hypothetical protein [Candidatus Yanofskybacteria bacterium]